MLEDELHIALFTKPGPTMAEIQDLYKEWVVLQFLEFFFQYLSGNAGIDSDFFRWLEFFQSVEYEVILAIVYSIQNL